MDYKEIISGNVLAEIGRRKWSQHHIAQGLGMSPAAFSSRVRGATDFKAGELVHLSQLLGVPFTRLIEGLNDADIIPSDQKEGGK